MNHQKCGWQGLSMVDWCQAESTRNLGAETIIRRYPNCPDNHVTAFQNQTNQGQISPTFFLPGISAATFVVEAGGKQGIGYWVTNNNGKDTVHDVEPLKWFCFRFYNYTCVQNHVSTKRGQFSAGSLTHRKLHAAVHAFSVVNDAPLSPLEIRKKQKVNHSETAINGWSLRMSTWAVLGHFVLLEDIGNLCSNFYFRIFPAFQEHNARLEDTQNISSSKVPFVIHVTRPTWTTPQTLQLKLFTRWFWGCSCFSRKNVTCSK